MDKEMSEREAFEVLRLIIELRGRYLSRLAKAKEEAKRIGHSLILDAEACKIEGEMIALIDRTAAILNQGSKE